AGRLRPVRRGRRGARLAGRPRGRSGDDRYELARTRRSHDPGELRGERQLRPAPELAEAAGELEQGPNRYGGERAGDGPLAVLTNVTGTSQRSPSAVGFARSDVNANLQTVDVVVPVYNEEASLRPNVEALLAYLRDEFPFRFRVVVADNASVDRTPEVADALARANDDVSVLRIDRKGRGLALKTAWLASDADVVSYMDVALSTNLESFLPLVAPLLSGHSEVSIGTRLAHSSHVRRLIRREVLSRGYNALIHLGFRAGFSDAQCGFKALRADAAHELLPLVRDEGWFFDTELLLLAERRGFRIH